MSANLILRIFLYLGEKLFLGFLTFDHFPALKRKTKMPFFGRRVHPNELHLNNKSGGSHHLIQLDLGCGQWLGKVQGSGDCVRCKWIAVTLEHVEDLDMSWVNGFHIAFLHPGLGAEDWAATQSRWDWRRLRWHELACFEELDPCEL